LMLSFNPFLLIASTITLTCGSFMKSLPVPDPAMGGLLLFFFTY